MTAIAVQADFLRDLREELLNRLPRGGFRLGPKRSVQDVCIAHFNVQKRWIQPKAHGPAIIETQSKVRVSLVPPPQPIQPIVDITALP